MSPFNSLFTDETLTQLFPQNLADAFFEALYGDADEGAYNIALKYNGYSDNELKFEFHLTQRPGKCIACNLTYGLPEVFYRHPLINLKGLAAKIDTLMNNHGRVSGWKLGDTREVSATLHVIPLAISIGVE